MSTQSTLEAGSEAVQAHLTMLQAVIQRMATNSASCKTWCVTLVSAVLVIVADKGKPQYVWLALVPTLLFLILDAYYLGLEWSFRNAYNDFIRKLHTQKLQLEDLFVIRPKGSVLELAAASIGSFAVWPFYLTLCGMTYAAKLLVIQ